MLNYYRWDFRDKRVGIKIVSGKRSIVRFLFFFYDGQKNVSVNGIRVILSKVNLSFFLLSLRVRVRVCVCVFRFYSILEFIYPLSFSTTRTSISS